jgi:hypothetical protein
MLRKFVLQLPRNQFNRNDNQKQTRIPTLSAHVRIFVASFFMSVHNRRYNFILREIQFVQHREIHSEDVQFGSRCDCRESNISIPLRRNNPSWTSDDGVASKKSNETAVPALADPKMDVLIAPSTQLLVVALQS